MSTAPGEDDAPQVVRITHPFHPLCGREFAFVYSKHCWGLDRVFCQGEDGRIRSFPAGWTDFAVTDSFVKVSAGRSAFRVTDLLELADFLVRARSAAEGTEEGT